MTIPISGGGNKFQTANGALERQVIQMGRGPSMIGAPIKSGEGNIPVAGGGREVTYAQIGKGDGPGVRGAAPIRLMGAMSPFGTPMTPGMGSSFAPAPTPMAPQQPQAAPAPAPVEPQYSLGAGDEVHTLVATLKGPSGQKYEATYDVVVPERGCAVMGVVERNR